MVQNLCPKYWGGGFFILCVLKTTGARKQAISQDIERGADNGKGKGSETR